MSKILIIAAEASSVLYAEQLIQYWNEKGMKHRFWGVGSHAMTEKLGFEALGFAEDMAVMGFFEVLGKYHHIKSVFKKVVDKIQVDPPDLAILIDYPGFNLKLSQELRKRRIPVIYYIPPQVWAWKKGRIQILRDNVDELLVVFPFEKEFYDKQKLSSIYVGHPLLDELKSTHLDQESQRARRGRLGISTDQLVLGLMPGSRIQEIERHLKVQLKTSEALLRKHPELRVVVMIAPTLEKSYIQEQLGHIRFPITLVQDNPYEMIGLADALLVASGTATLMVGLLEKPMIIMYKTSSITAFIGRRLFSGFFGLVNILCQRELVPELFQEEAIPEKLIPLVEQALYDQSWRNRVIEGLKQMKGKLGGPGGIERVAAVIEKHLSLSRDQRS